MTNIKPQSIPNSMSVKEMETDVALHSSTSSWTKLSPQTFSWQAERQSEFNAQKLLFAVKISIKLSHRENCTMQIAHPAKGCVKMSAEKRNHGNSIITFMFSKAKVLLNRGATRGMNSFQNKVPVFLGSWGFMIHSKVWKTSFLT